MPITSHPHRSRRRFGQHFLVDRRVVTRIIDAIAPREGESIIEIGPGKGALTGPLLERAHHLHVIEIDRDLAQALTLSFSNKALTVHPDDALEFDFSGLGKNLRLVGNLPYNISTPLLFRFAGYANAIRDAHVMLQKEVAERLAARPSSSDYGRLSVMLQSRFAIEKLFDVAPGAFRPAPKVDSSVVRMAPLAAAPVGEYPLLGKIVTAAFSKRRKVLKNALAELVPLQAWEAVEINPELRPENLSVEDYLRIARYLEATSSR
jgi:16S rRNA (adenine1518-N6/adenine1519-N6)-dimethyltransferase